MSKPTTLTYFVACGAWNFSLGISMLVVPLYAHDLGMSGTEIGALLGLPVIGQILMSLVGGLLTDRVGGRRMLLISFAAMVAAGLVYSRASGFGALITGQCLLVVSRAVYWPSSQAIASGLPGVRSVLLGRLGAISNIGQMVGTTLAGLLLARWSFNVAFLALAGFGGSALLLGALSSVGYRVPAPHAGSLAGVGDLLRRRGAYFSIACAYLAAVPATLSHSFYPILLVEQGFPVDGTGGLMVLRAAGAIAVTLLLAGAIRSRGGHGMSLAAVAGIVAGIGLLPLAHGALPVAVLLFVAGAGSGVMFVYYQVVAVEISEDGNRGLAMAVTGLGYGLSHLTTPLLMGALADLFGIAVAFHLLGGIVLLVAAAYLPLYRWAMEQPQAG